MVLFEPSLTPVETTPFEFGGQTIRVPLLNLAIMKLCKESILSLGPGLDFISYAETVVHIAYMALKFEYPNLATTEEDLLRRCMGGNIRNLPGQMNAWLEASGFEVGAADPTNAAEAAIPGTGTSTASQPNLPPTESAAAISTGFSDPIPSEGLRNFGEPGPSILRSAG
jgi:hypothetical protein